MSDLLTPTGGSNLTFKVSFDLFIFNFKWLFNICDPGLSHWGIFVAIANNILYGLKLYIFILCQKSLAY